MSNLTLLGLQISVYMRIARLALEEKKLDYVLKEIDVFADAGPPLDYLQYQPFGMIPCLNHGEFSLYETSAITRYIDEAFPGPALQPDAAIQRARMNQIIAVLDAYAYRPMVWDVFVQRIVVPEEGGQSDERIISEAIQSICLVLDQLNLWLDGNEFLVGSSITLADLHGLPMLLYFVRTPEGRIILESYPGLQQWLDRMKQRDSVKTTRSLYD